MATLKVAIDASKAKAGAVVFNNANVTIQNSAKKTDSAISRIGHTSRRSFDIMKKSVNAALLPLKALVAVSAASKAATLGIGAYALKAAGDYEMFEQQLQTVINTKKEADKAFQESLDFSVATPFTPDEIIRTRVELESVGVRGAAAVEKVASAAAAMNRQIGDVASAVKSMETEPLRRLGVQLSKQGDEFTFKFRNRIGEANLIAVKGFEQAQQSLLDIFDDKFDGGLDRMSLTLHGLKSTLDGVKKDLAAEFGEGFIDEAKLVVNDIIEAGKGLKSDAGEAGRELGDELFHARTSLLAAFDVGMVMADQIKEAVSSGNGGDVILAAFDLGSDLAGQAIVASFKASLELWKTIGMIVGQGVIDALYRSELPFAESLRERSIQKTVKGMDADTFKSTAKELGYQIGGRDLVLDYRNGQGPKTVFSDEDIQGLTNAIQGLSIDKQLEYTSRDPGEVITERINTANDVLREEISKIGDVAVTGLQEFEDRIAKASGGDSKNLKNIYDDQYLVHLLEGTDKMMEIREKLNSENSSVSSKDAVSASEQHAQALSKEQQAVQDMFDTLKFERSLLGKTNDERERAIEMLKLQKAAEDAYGKDTPEYISKINEYRNALIELQDAKRLEDNSMSKYADELTYDMEHSGEYAATKMAESARSMESAFSNAFSGMITGADSFGEAMTNLRTSITNSFANMIGDMIARWVMFQTVTGIPGLSGLFGGNYGGLGGGTTTDSYSSVGIGTYAANGMVVPQGISGYSNSIVDRPTIFPFASGIGLMGEAGPEAIMPLKRGPDGRLGVSGGGMSVVNEINIQNNSSQQVNAKVGDTKFDGNRFVTNIVLEDLASNGPIARNIAAKNNN